MLRNAIALLVPLTAFAQTQLDLRTQSKSVDFTNSAFTRPVKTGTVLPAACSTGDLFFNTASAAGSNLYGCVSANTWALQSGGGGGGGGGSLTVQANGTTVGSRGIEDFISGTGVLNALSDTGTQINIQQTADTAVLLSRSTEQAGTTVLCAPASGSGSAYTCALSPTLTAYTSGMALHWRPDVNGAGGATTLNIDTLGAVAVKQFDGTTDPTDADIVANRLFSLWYDGTVFRLMTAPVNVAATASQPACSATQRGRIWQTLGGAGVKDQVSVCAKDATDAYAWRVLY
jgi:hypothetical protein